MRVVAAPRPGRTVQLAAGGAVLFAAVYVAWLGFGPQTFGDYPTMFAPSMNALLSGHLGVFFAHLPADGAGGSVLLRAPFALAGKLTDTPFAIFRFGTLECALALGLLGLWLAGRVPEGCNATLARCGIILLYSLLPLVLNEVLFGHPEGSLGAALSVTGILAAGGGRTSLAAVAIGLSAVNKPWGVLAGVPALMACRHGRLRFVVIAGLVAGAWYGMLAALWPGHFMSSLDGAPTGVAWPFDVWWPLAKLHAPPGVMAAYFTPGFLKSHGREIAVLVALAAAIPVARRRSVSTEDCLALLALSFLVRCLFDPGNHVYYAVPYIAALGAWEARTRGLPVLALMQTGLLWLVFHTIAGVASLNVQFAAYLLVVLPAGWVLAGAVAGRPSRLSSADRDRDRGRQLVLGASADGA